jgi:hypothetical protein
MSTTAAELLGELVREQATRTQSALEAYERENQALRGLARMQCRQARHDQARVATEAGIGRVTIYAWLEADVLSPAPNASALG